MQETIAHRRQRSGRLRTGLQVVAEAISTIRATGLMTVGVRKARQLEVQEEEQLSQSLGSRTDTTLVRVFTPDGLRGCKHVIDFNLIFLQIFFRRATFTAEVFVDDGFSEREGGVNCGWSKQRRRGGRRPGYSPGFLRR